jgi:hypothetical protein
MHHTAEASPQHQIKPLLQPDIVLVFVPAELLVFCIAA